MIIPVDKELTKEQLAEVRSIAADFNVEIHPAPGTLKCIYSIIGEETDKLMINRIEGLPYIQKVKKVSVPYKLLSKESEKNAPHNIINGKELGKELIVIAGPCTVDPSNPQYFLETAHAVKAAGADVIRGGVWKPRTSPYSFQGSDDGLEILMQASKETGLKVITEVMDDYQVEKALEAGVHMLQVGARNALNYKLLKHIGELSQNTDTMVLLKRSIHLGSTDEFILAGEYIAGNGNLNVALCPRGTLPAMSGYRNHPDESITQLLKEKTWAPIIVDPSHSVGKAKYVPSAALAAVAYGADGVIIESHSNPIKGIGDDPKQAITPETLTKLIPKLRTLAEFVKD